MTISPGTKNSKKPQFSVGYLSEVLPPQASDTKEMFPWGGIPIKTLIVLWCLYVENVWALASKLDGCSMNTSKQSITTVTFLPKAYWKHIGIVFHNCSLSGHEIMNFSLTSMTTIQNEKILETVVTDTTKRYARSCKGTLSLSLMRTLTNSWKWLRFWVFLETCEETCSKTTISTS